jgi:DNA-binding NarL/FixJ family response regulator
MRDVSGQVAMEPAGDGAPRAAPPTTVLLADEYPLIRRGVRAILDSDPAFRILGEASDGHALLELARKHRPDVVLMDAALPGPNILDTVHRLVEGHSRPIAVALLTAERGLADSWVFGAARAGVRGFLFKHGETAEILSGVREVARGGAAMSMEIIGQILEALRSTYWPTALRPCADFSLLTPREMQIFLLVSHGLTNQQISEELVLSEATVKSHFNRICHKLTLRNRVDAVILAYEMGLAKAVNVHRPATMQPHITGESALPGEVTVLPA